METGQMTDQMTDRPPGAPPPDDAVPAAPQALDSRLPPSADDGLDRTDSSLRARALETVALIELLDRDGQVRQIVRVPAWPVRIGRAIDCDVVVDDPHVAAHQATLQELDGVVWLVPQRSLNPVRIGRRRLPPEGHVALDASTVVTLGTTPMRVRFAGEALARELPLRGPQHAQGWRAAALVLLFAVGLGWVAFDQWLDTLPGTPVASQASMLLVAPVALFAWCGLWALGSKLFTRHFAFWPHLEVALFWSLAAMVSLGIGDVLAFSLSLPELASIGHAGALASFAMMLWRHLGLVLPQRRRGVGWAVLAVIGLALGLDVAERRFHEQPLAGDLYLTALQPPSLRLVHPSSVDGFVQSARPLEKQLGHLARDQGDDEDDEDDEED
jgi:hypothetical protein